MSKRACRNCENCQIPLSSQSTNSILPPPLCFSQTTANHPPTAHCGFTLIGNQKQTIIQAYTRPGKTAKASYTVKTHLMELETLTAVKVSKQEPPLPCAFDRKLRLTHPLLELSLGCLAKQALTASPLNFGRPQWLEHGPGPCSSQNFRATFLQNRSDIKGPTPEMQSKTSS